MHLHWFSRNALSFSELYWLRVLTTITYFGNLIFFFFFPLRWVRKSFSFPTMCRFDQLTLNTFLCFDFGLSFITLGIGRFGSALSSLYINVCFHLAARRIFLLSFWMTSGNMRCLQKTAILFYFFTNFSTPLTSELSLGLIYLLSTRRQNDTIKTAAFYYSKE